MDYKKKILNKWAIGEKIRLEMLKNNLTYEELAFILELTSPRVIYDWVNGKKLPKLENFINICNLFNVKMEEFIVFI